MANSNLPRRIIKETQRLLSEPGWRALCLAVSVDFVRFFDFVEG